jgi:alpha-glucosidase (family GH31 glycosyl hydrolase)
VLRAEGDALELSRGGTTLAEAYRSASERYFPASGRTPATALFAQPQYNTWIEQPYAPTQESVLAYARGLLAAGLPAGTIIIDDSWSPGYGTWRFDTGRFPDPRAMVDELHALGFPVMLWVVPFVSPDSAVFRDLDARGLLLHDADGATAIRQWWNGWSAQLDLSDPAAIAWLTGELDALVAETGVDGFKFDGGDVRDHRPGDRTASPAEPVDMCEAWARLGTRYPFNEFRACWRMGGQPLGQRLEDKPPAWTSAGIGALLPEMLAQAMIGHPFTCPDMIGGGEIGAVSSDSVTDQEFFVRYAQLAAVSPMTQFSTSPARVLDDEHLAAVRAALALRESLMPRILALVEAAARTGEPVLRPMAYHASDMDDVTDQCFLGPDTIIAPVTEQGATSRRVLLPSGTWRDADGVTVAGPVAVDVACTLLTIPVFERVVG